MLYISSSNHINVSNTASASEKRKPQTAQQLILANLQGLIGQLDAGPSDALTANLNAVSCFHPHNFVNSLEIARQHPAATRVVEVYTRNQLGHHASKGEMEMTSTSASCIFLYHNNASLLAELPEVGQRTAAVILAALDDLFGAVEDAGAAEHEPRRARRHRQQLADAEVSECLAEAV